MAESYKAEKRGRGILKHTMTGVGTDLVTTLLIFMTSIILARVLGPADRGSFSLITLINLLLGNLLILGMGSASEIHLAKREYSLAAVHTCTLIFSAGVGCAGVLLFYLSKAFLFQSWLSEIDSRLLFISVLLVPAFVYSFITNRMLIGMSEITAFNYFKLLKTVLDLVGVVLFLLMIPMGMEGAVMAWAGSLVLAVLLKSGWLLHRAGWRLEMDKWILFRSVLFGSKIHSSFLPAMMMTYLGFFILNYFSGAREVGLYAVAFGAMFKISMLCAAFLNASQVRIIAESQKVSEAFVRRLIRHSVFILCCLAVVLCFVSKPLIQGFYGAAFLPSASALMVMVPGVIGMSVSNIFNSYVVGQLKKTGLNASVNWGIFVFGVLAYLFIVPRFGLIGTAASFSVVMVSRVVVYLAVLRWGSLSILRETFIINQEDVSYGRIKFRNYLENMKMDSFSR